MAVDVKTLTIGSHVEYEGKRVRVALVREDGCICEYKDNGQDVVIGIGIEKNPIPITSDLLKELGFKWRKDSACWRKYQNYDGERYGWGIYAYGSDGGTWCFSLYLPNFLIKPQLYAQHLHELEGQLAYYGVELIKE